MQPERLLYRLWAKTNELSVEYVPGAWTRHPLPLHLLDVGLVADVWLEEDTGLLQRFCDLWPDAKPIALRRALVLAAAAHDVGKLYPRFQAKSEIGWTRGYGQFWSAEKPNGRGFDHGAGTGRVFTTLCDADFLGGLPDAIAQEWVSIGPLLRSAAGHHGTLYEDGRIAFDDDVLGAPLFKDLVPCLLAELAYHFGPPLPLPPNPPPAFLLLAAGLVSVADWFGSNTDSFPPAPDVTDRPAASIYLEHHRKSRTVEVALRDAGLIADFAVPDTFAGLFSPEGESWVPREGFQTAACGVPFGRVTGPEIAVVEAPMGLGKTEIALFLAAEALRFGSASGIYVALPTQATSNALYHRVKQFGGRLVGSGNLALVLAHGAKNYFSDYRTLREDTRRRTVFDGQGRTHHTDSTPPSEVIAPSWVQPSKRALLAPLGLGTVDQALLAAMGVKHGFVRLFGLARKVVILDEVHAYDVYMGTLLEHLLGWLGALESKVILLSATLPARLRAKLLTAYGASNHSSSDSYPQLLHAVRTDDATVLQDLQAESAPHAELSVEPVEGGADADSRTAEGAAWVCKRVQQGGCVAWIRNTVREAQAAYGALRAAGVEAELLHARFVRSDRNMKEEALLSRFGKPAPDNPNRPTARVVVATQVIEQSVDLDFDVMLSDLAPVDLLLQRAGRVHRHERTGMRHGHDTPVLGVLLPEVEARRRLDFGNSVYVYDADTLARSAALVLEHRTWRLPGACRSLVADLYDRGESYWTADRLGSDPEALAAARERVARLRSRMEHAALRTLLTPPDQIPVMRDPRNDRSDAGEFVALTTRYGAHSAVAVLFHHTPDGPIPIGSDSPLVPPPGEDWRGRLDAEETVALASVSFPWYGPRPADTAPPSPLSAVHVWWRETHPFDDRLFLLLDSFGSFSHPSVVGRYDRDVGLTVARPTSAPAKSEPAPLEDL